MSPAMKSKSKSAASRAIKEQVQASPKLPASAISGNGVPASGYNPVSGTFHTLESKSPGSLPVQKNNGRFRIIDKNEENSGSSSGTIDYDSLSNNGSSSGDSEDPKEKLVNSSACCTEPVSGVDADKRDKVRQKNEKKHQRQKEKRAQELHERCSGYLMARKLETLSQKLVAMGFSFERATMALMLNKGHLEESVSWLFDGGDASKEAVPTSVVDSSNLKIDIAEEFARIVDMELNFKCTKQEVERAVVACEGDLDKAEEVLKSQKQSVPFSSQKTEEPATTPATAISEFNHKLAWHVSPSQSNSGAKAQGKGAALAISSIQQPKKDEMDFNPFKAVAAAPGGTVDAANKSLQAVQRQPLRRAQTKVADWPSPPDAPSSEKKWRSNGSTSQSFTYSMASPSFQDAVVPSNSSEARTATTATVGAEVKSILPGRTLREPVIVMQRPQSAKQNNLASASIGAGASPAATTGWLPSSGGLSSKMDGKATNVAAVAHSMLPSLGLNSSSAQPFYPRGNFQPFVPSNMVESGGGGGGASWSTAIGASASPIAAPSSLGLFTGWGSSSGSATSPLPVDWSTGSMVSRFDYKNIDWSLDAWSLDAWSSDAKHPKNGWSSDSWSPPPSLSKATVVSHHAANGSFALGFPAMEDASFLVESPSPAESREWTSPFEGRDLFRLPRQFVASPSL